MAGKTSLKDSMTFASTMALDSIFSTEEMRQEAKLQKVFEIPLSEIRDFENHPYKVRDDEAMQNLMESVMTRGVDTPVLIRPLKEGGYEMVSGHRRKRASELAGKDTIPAIIEEMTRDESIIKMVESNYQRDTILPSEKAFAYKMRLDAMHRMAGRPSKDNPAQVGLDLRGKQSRELLAEDIGESKSQIQRFIRLTELIPELLEMVDNDKLKQGEQHERIPTGPAYEISFLEPDLQAELLNAIQAEECTPSLAQARRMREAAENGTLDFNGITLVLSEEKPIERKVVLSGERFDRLIPKDYDTPRQRENYIYEALYFYQRHRDTERQRQEQAHSR